MTSLALVDVVAPLPDPDSPHARIVDAALRCIGRWGLAKTTVDDIAREAGVGRATLYRLYPGGRDAVLDAVVVTETSRFFVRLDEAVAAADSLEDLLTIVIAEAGTSLVAHTPLRFLLDHEPEVILPCLAFQQFDAVLRVVATLGGPWLAPWLSDGDAASRAAEWVTRIVLSYAMAPSADVDFADRDSVRRLVRTYILPGLVPTTNGWDPHARH